MQAGVHALRVLPELRGLLLKSREQGSREEGWLERSTSALEFSCMADSAIDIFDWDRRI
jgi:hypothetical protein